MAEHDIQKSQHLLKRLEEEMNFLSSLMAQAGIVSSNLEGTLTAIRVTMTTGKEIFSLRKQLLSRGSKKYFLVF